MEWSKWREEKSNAVEYRRKKEYSEIYDQEEEENKMFDEKRSIDDRDDRYGYWSIIMKGGNAPGTDEISNEVWKYWVEEGGITKQMGIDKVQ